MTSAPVIRVQADIVVAKVAGQHDRARGAQAEVDAQRYALAGEDLRGVLLLVLRRRAVDDEGDVCRVEGDLLQGKTCAAAADGGEDAAPVRIAAVQCRLHERR